MKVPLVITYDQDVEMTDIDNGGPRYDQSPETQGSANYYNIVTPGNTININSAQQTPGRRFIRGLRRTVPKEVLSYPHLPVGGSLDERGGKVPPTIPLWLLKLILDRIP